MKENNYINFSEVVEFEDGRNYSDEVTIERGEILAIFFVMVLLYVHSISIVFKNI